MSHHNSHSLVHAVAGISAGLLVHNVALSSFDALSANLNNPRLTAIAGANTLILLASLATGLLSFLLATRLRRALTEGHRITGTSLLDTALLTQTPGWTHLRLLAFYGLAAIAFLSSLHALAHIVWHWLHHSLHLPHLLIIAASALLALALAAWVGHNRRAESRGTKGTPGNNDALILFLSAVDDDKIAVFSRLPAALPMPWRKGPVLEILGAHAWAVPARSISRIWENRSLQHIVVIGSITSWPQIPAFAESIRRGMAGSPAQIHTVPAAGIDFRDFAAVQSSVDLAYKLLEEKGMSRIAIDLTSGTKICTAVGLLASLPPGRSAIYVTHLLDVHAYDFEHFDSGWSALPHEGP